MHRQDASLSQLTVDARALKERSRIGAARLRLLCLCCLAKSLHGQQAISPYKTGQSGPIL